MELACVEGIYIPALAWMPLKEVRMLLDKDRVEHVLYPVRIAGFRWLGDVFLTQLECIRSRYQEGCTTVCQQLENQVLYLVHLILLKDQRFENYMVKYSREKVKEEIDKLISSSRLQKQAANGSPESFETFSYINVDKKHRRHALFTQALLCKCVDSSDAIMANLDAMGNDNISMRDHMTERPLLKDRTTFQHNCALVAVLALSMLCYA